jgi:hypothetical protein
MLEDSYDGKVALAEAGSIPLEQVKQELRL